MFVWLQFAICLIIIIIAGTRLAKYGDLIAEKTGLGRVWVGVMLLAAATSMPEIATGFSAVVLLNEPDLAVGDLFGASLMNLGIIAVIAFFHKKGPVLRYVSSGIVLSTALGLLLIAAAGAFLFLSQNLPTLDLFGRVSIYSVILFLMYLLSQLIIYRFQSKDKQPPSTADVEENGQVSLLKIWSYFGLSTIVVAAAGIWLAQVGDQISATTGLSASFVGTLFLAISTTAPEMVVSISAARLGALDMAVGNVVGSNLFNMGVVIFVNDMLYSGGSILEYVHSHHIITAFFAVMMSCIVIIGITYRPGYWRRAWIGLDTGALLALYISALVTLYMLGSG